MPTSRAEGFCCFCCRLLSIKAPLVANEIIQRIIALDYPQQCTTKTICFHNDSLIADVIKVLAKDKFPALTYSKELPQLI